LKIFFFFWKKISGYFSLFVCDPENVLNFFLRNLTRMKNCQIFFIFPYNLMSWEKERDDEEKCGRRECDNKKPLRGEIEIQRNCLQFRRAIVRRHLQGLFALASIWIGRPHKPHNWLPRSLKEQQKMIYAYEKRIILRLCSVCFGVKWFRHFPVFGRGEKNNQPENDFCLTKNA
jgi:hypothetical protein